SLDFLTGQFSFNGKKSIPTFPLGWNLKGKLSFVELNNRNRTSTSCIRYKRSDQYIKSRQLHFQPRWCFLTFFIDGNIPSADQPLGFFGHHLCSGIMYFLFLFLFCCSVVTRNHTGCQ